MIEKTMTTTTNRVHKAPTHSTIWTLKNIPDDVEMSGGVSAELKLELSLGSISLMASVKRAAVKSNELVLI